MREHKMIAAYVGWVGQRRLHIVFILIFCILNFQARPLSVPQSFRRSGKTEVWQKFIFPRPLFLFAKHAVLKNKESEGFAKILFFPRK